MLTVYLRGDPEEYTRGGEKCKAEKEEWLIKVKLSLDPAGD